MNPQPGKAGIVTLKEVRTISMVEGKERQISTIIDEGVVKQWVGIGWIDLDEKPDPDIHPVLVR